VPLRTKAFDTFTSAARYQVASSVASSTTAAPSPVFSAGWGALYTISTAATFDDPKYTSLRTQRSPREAELLARVATLDRRIYRCVYDSAAPQPRDTSASGAPAPVRTAPLPAAEASPCVVCTSVTPADGCKAEYDTWYVEEHAPLLAKVPGWRRSRRYELVDALIVGKQARPANADGAEVPFCLALNGECGAALCRAADADPTHHARRVGLAGLPGDGRVQAPHEHGVAQQGQRPLAHRAPGTAGHGAVPCVGVRGGGGRDEAVRGSRGGNRLLLATTNSWRRLLEEQECLGARGLERWRLAVLSLLR
jgi:hypothetical protein